MPAAANAIVMPNMPADLQPERPEPDLRLALGLGMPSWPGIA